MIIPCRQLCDNSKSVHYRHVVIKHDTVRVRQIGMIECLRAACAGPYLKSIELKLEFKGVPDGSVIVYNEDDIWSLCHEIWSNRHRNRKMAVPLAAVVG